MNLTQQDQDTKPSVITKRVILDLVIKHRSIGFSSLIKTLGVKADKRHLERLRRTIDSLNKKNQVVVTQMTTVLDDMSNQVENIVWEPEYYKHSAPKGSVQV